MGGVDSVITKPAQRSFDGWQRGSGVGDCLSDFDQSV